MKSLTDWKFERLREDYDPEWDQLKHVWGSGNKKADNFLVNKLKLKIESIVDQYIKNLNNPAITTFRDLPPENRESLAQSLVIATLKAFYSQEGNDPTGGKSSFNADKLGKFQKASEKEILNPLTSDDNEPPTGWKG